MLPCVCLALDAPPISLKRGQKKKQLTVKSTVMSKVHRFINVKVAH